MAKRKQYKRRRGVKSRSIHPDAKTSVIGIAVIGVAALFVLAGVGMAGPVGDFTYEGLQKVFGWGYYLIPFILIAIGLGILTNIKRAVTLPTFIGSGFFIASGLGIIDIIFEGMAGFVGSFLGNLELLFGYPASLVINLTILIASAVVAINLPLKLKIKLPKRRKVEKGKEEKEPQIIIPSNDAPDTVEKKIKRNKRGKGKDDDISDSVTAPIAPEGELVYEAKNYVFPPLSLLGTKSEKPTVGDLRANANIIKRTLEGFGIPVEMGEITIGPKVTRYTLKPAEGVKLSRIVALNQDISLALAAHPIRIEAPIPGKSFAGIEVPNKVGSIVRLGSLLAYPDFKKGGYLNFPLGRDVTGEPLFVNLTKMPHLLIAGATGSGKSVTIHTLILSLLYNNSPETLRFIFIDPKRVELSIYDGIPHLVSPVIIDGKKALGALRYAINEMENRYETLLGAGKRDILSYNKGRKNNPMPYIVIVIDELADLMAAHGREVEGAIVRLAQMARATGIHLVVSTQRPSVEVITGLIKANITSRVALQVASQIDSRTILDTPGAEKLLGSGDMLFISSDISKPKRVQGSFVTEEEIQAVSRFIKKRNPEAQSDELHGAEDEMLKDGDFESFSNKDTDDELYVEALEVIQVAKKASASLLQRRLRIGYARAARLLDIMEDRGVIGPADGAKPREVYMDGKKDE